MKSLPNEREAVILVCLLKGEMYGLQLRDAYRERSGIDLPLGSVYTTMDRMEKKKFVKSRMGETTPERRGARRRYFKLTATGLAALNAIRDSLS